MALTPTFEKAEFIACSLMHINWTLKHCESVKGGRKLKFSFIYSVAHLFPFLHSDMFQYNKQQMGLCRLYSCCRRKIILGNKVKDMWAGRYRQR